MAYYQNALAILRGDTAPCVAVHPPPPPTPRLRSDKGFCDFFESQGISIPGGVKQWRLL